MYKRKVFLDELSMKICNKCKEDRPLSEFYSNKKSRDGLSYSCKSCTKEYESNRYLDPKTRQDKLSYEKKKYERLAPEQKTELSKSKDHRKYNKKYYWINRKSLLDANKKWRDNNLEWQRKQSKKRYATAMGNLNSRMSCSINKALRLNGSSKDGQGWNVVVGYTLDQLRDHLESLFVDGMGWHNRDMWHIDHIIPQSFFKFSSPNDVEFRMCWRMENLQPLWAIDNIRKGNKIRAVA